MNDDKWQLSRRKFVQSLLLGGIALQFPWLAGCDSTVETKIPTNILPLSKTAFLNLRSLLNVLFPSDGNGPGSNEIKAAEYILWVLNDEELDPQENQYIVKKLRLVNELAVNETTQNFHELSESKQDDIIQLAIQIGWGKRFFSRLLTLTFEALLTHPLYGGNTDESGWDWLQHNPGNPRSTKELAYPTILKKQHEV